MPILTLPGQKTLPRIPTCLKDTDNYQSRARNRARLRRLRSQTPPENTSSNMADLLINIQGHTRRPVTSSAAAVAIQSLSLGGHASQNQRMQLLEKQIETDRTVIKIGERYSPLANKTGGEKMLGVAREPSPVASHDGLLPEWAEGAHGTIQESASPIMFDGGPKS